MRTFFKLVGRTDVLLFLLCVLLLTEFPAIDIQVSREFFDASLNTFSHKDDILIYAIYAAITKLPLLLLVLLPVLAVRSYFRFQKQDQRRWHCCFLLACLLLGPGLLVNTIIKDNSVGRARPVQVQEFAGEKTFTPAFAYSGQCQRNCSFVSGHAAMGFYFIALGWVLGSSSVFLRGLPSAHSAASLGLCKEGTSSAMWCLPFGRCIW